MTDLTKWRMVPVEAVREMLDAAHFGPNCAEEGLSAQDEQFWIDVWEAMIATAPAPPVVEVSDEVCQRIYDHWVAGAPDIRGQCQSARTMIAAVQTILGPTLGLVTLEEMARAVEAAYLEAVEALNPCFTTADTLWHESEARKRLEGRR